MTRWSPPALLLAFLAITFPLWCNAYLSPPDSASYLAVARSAVMDGDIDFYNDFESMEFERYMYYLTSAGRISNDWPVGSGVVWMPAFAVGHAVARGAAAVGIEGKVHPPGEPGRGAGILPRPVGTGAHDPLFKPNGRSGIHRLAINLYTVFLAWGALVLGWRWARDHAGAGPALAAAVLVLLGTPVGFYLYAFALMSHIPSMLAVGLVVWLWASTREHRGPREWALCGAAAGAAALVRPQDALAVLPFAIELVVRARRGTLDIRAWAIGVAIAAGAALLVFSPQLVTWWCLYGNPLQFPKIEEMHWWRPQLWETLFSPYHGIVSWSPLLALVPLGLARLWRRDALLAAGIGAVIAVQVYLNAANEIWWAGGSFGNRRLVSCGVLFIVALAPLLAPWRGRWIVVAAAVPFALWNLALWATERAGMLSLDHYVPWDGTFLRNVLAHLLPHRLAWAMMGDFAGFGWVARGIAMAALLAVALLIDRIAPPGAARWRWARGVGIAALCQALVMPPLFLVLAARTPVYTPQDFDHPVARENLSLFNGYYEYGFYLMARGRPEEALAAYERASALLPGHPNPWRYIATLQLTAFNDPEAALESSARALDLNPRYGAALQVHAEAALALVSREPWRRDLLAAVATRFRAAGQDDAAAHFESLARPAPPRRP